MWWLDPGKEVLNVLFNRILAPYVENLDLNQVNYGIAQGQLTLRNLRLKKGVLDKFQLPIDVLEGHLGTFTLSLHWMNLGNQPVEILIEDVYLLVVPSPQTNVDPAEEEARMQAAKAERLESAELLHMRGQAEKEPDSAQNQGLIQSLITKIINNVQVTIKNIHIRYEDKMSVPGHPFAAGITLSSFAAVSVDKQWKPAFIESTAGAIHKLAQLQSLAVYFDTDAESMAGLERKEAIEKFSAMIHDTEGKWKHQYILKPVSGEGRIVVNHKVDKNTPRFDIELLFDEIGVALDDDQYRDVISLVDMYQVYMRKHQYKKHSLPEEERTKNPARARLLFAGNAILSGVREKNRKWTWQYFAERRDDRNKYVELFQKRMLNNLLGEDLTEFQRLEKKLSYEDLRFYRSIARSRLRKDEELRKRLQEDKKKEQTRKQSWTSWIWGSSSDETPKEDLFGGVMTEEQRKQLYDVLDYDEKTSLMEALQAPRDSLKMQVTAKLKRGSFTLKTDPRGAYKDAISVVFDIFSASFIQRPGNFEASLSLQDLHVYDGTTSNTLYPQIVRVKQDVAKPIHIELAGVEQVIDPFFFVKFENNPLDDRADNAVTVRMRHMEIIYHKGYIEAIYKFFKPPSSQLESVEALLNVASQTLEGLRKETRAGLEYALQTHKTVDLHVDMNAPVIIIPEE